MKAKQPKISPPDGVNILLTPEQVCMSLSCSMTELRRRIANGEFPKNESPQGKDPRWRLSTVNAWINQAYSGK